MRLRGSRNASKSGNLSRGITLATAIPFPADPAGKLESLQATLEELHTAPKTRQFEQGKGQNQIDTVKWPIFDCEVVVNGLQEEHDKLSVTVGKAVIDIHQASDHAAAYPFRRSTVQRLHEIVDDLQGQASSMLNGLNPKQEKVVNGDDDDDDDDLARLKAPIRHMNPQDEDWYLRSDFPLSMQQSITVLYMPNARRTGLWLQKPHPFQERLGQENSLLWPNGAPGCGKSVICSTAVQSTFCQQKQQRKHMSDVGIAFFYFS